MTSITFRSGMRTIGGTIVELISNSTRIIFDFGTVYDPGSTEEILPRVDGIYDGTSKYDDHVLISHLHLDHIKALNLLPNDVPIYMHQDSVEMINSLKTVNFNQILGNWRKYNEITTTKQIGDFKVTPFLVDHDVPGAVAFHIENKDLSIIYTGDIRMHGNNKQLTHNFIKSCQELEIDALICEGVTISFIEDDYQIISSLDVVEEEKDIVDQLASELDPHKPLFFSPYIMGVERLNSFLQLANLYNRTLVLTPESGFIASKYLNSDNILVLGDDKFDSGFQTISLEQVNENHICQFEYEHFQVYRPHMHGCKLVMCGGEPLGDYDPRYGIFMKQLNNDNITVIIAGVGGHASPENLKYIVDQINPKYLIPLHSFKPELLKGENSIQLLPDVNHKYIFKAHCLEE